MCSSRDDAQAGNDKINDCLESKLLDANTDKTIYILIGGETAVETIRRDIINHPLTLGDTILKEKSSYNYLGDVIHMDGVSKSALATIKQREGRIINAINEVKSIIEDCRMQSVGGALAGLEIWELAFIPSILTNADTWVEIDTESIKILNNLQYMMYRNLLNTPRSTTKSSGILDL